MLVVTPFEVFSIFLMSILAGLIGAVFGLGGGILIIPFLTLVEGVPVPYAVGASIISVVATSSASAATYVQDRLTNLRLGMFLEVGTVLGAITGAFVAAFLDPAILLVLFGILLIYASATMIVGPRIDFPSGVVPDKTAQRLRLGSEYFDPATGTTSRYEVTNTLRTLGISGISGIVSGLLGVGGGIISVPTMNLLSKVPMKVASATSNFMIGVTAAASSSVYFVRGDVQPLLVAPLMVGVVIGAAVGTRLLRRTPPLKVKLLFAILLITISIAMILKGFFPQIVL
ncbi:MAG: permease [Crenarchaeota archaeon 13_1_40CM_2_52_14]|nr:MAG: permease [Crenarchaeota archaeon 13_1_40CM_3_52_17]OLD34968.1 MAG: permease [Crenarchaeota archaeon 13_1_40CM_2_52_14]OLE70323.1 MAG: permease [archaeon 13_1_20CM_2_51_12]